MKDFFSLLNGFLSSVLIILAMYVAITTRDYDKANFLLLISISSYLAFRFYFIEKKIDKK